MMSTCCADAESMPPGLTVERLSTPSFWQPLRVRAFDRNVERFAPERHRDDRQAIRTEFGTGDATVWLFVGSGWQRKGLDIAIEILAGVEDASTQLWVVGRDHPRRWRKLVRRLGVESRTRFLGECKDLERYYAAADGLLLPTRYDAFGLVCLEAAAAGLPVVTSKNAGASERFESCGRVVHDCANPLAYAQVMNDLARKEPRAELGEPKPCRWRVNTIGADTWPNCGLSICGFRASQAVKQW